MLRAWAGVLLVGLVAACGVPPEDAARPLPAGGALAPLNQPTGVATPGPRSEVLQFVRGPALVAVERPTAQLTPASVLSDLLSGPLPDERARGLSTALPTPSDLRVAAVDGQGVVDVVLGGDLLDSGRSDQVLALAQVVVSLDALPQVTAVRFLRGGAPVAVPRADGAVVATPMTASDYLALVEAR